MVRPRGRSVSRRHARAQALVEFALVIPIFMTIVMGLVEFAFYFSTTITVAQATRDGAAMVAAIGPGACADEAMLDRIGHSMIGPVSANRIVDVQVYWSNPDGSKIGSFVSDYTPGGVLDCILADNSHFNPAPKFTRNSDNFPEDQRCATLIGCGGAHMPTVDLIAVRVEYKYTPITPLGALLPGGQPDGSRKIVQWTTLRLEPQE